MDSHLDSDAMERRSTFMDSLRSEADRIRSHGRSKITGGDEGEWVVSQWESGGISVIQRPNDAHGILRISVGGGDDLPVNVNYVVFRGDRTDCINLLKRALVALEVGPPVSEPSI